MPVSIQSGESVDRLREFFRLTGRIPVTLDEVVVPTAVLADLSLPPYRVSTQDGAALFRQGPVAARFSFGGVDMLAGVPGALVVTGVLVSNVTNAVGVLRLQQQNSAQYLADVSASTQLPNIEDAGRQERLAPRIVTGSLASATAGVPLGDFYMEAERSRYFPVRTVIRAGLAVLLTNAGANLNCFGTIYGTYYPDSA